MRLIRILLPLLWLLSMPAQAIEEIDLQDPSKSEDYHELITELRCMVCQNQSISDSNADLAKDFRNQVKEKLNAGQSKEQIIDYMVARYGDYILYKPPFNPATALLWLGPFLLLIGGGVIVYWVIRQPSGETEVSAEELAQQQARLHALMDAPDETPSEGDKS